jgi:hypothetical protein
MARPDGLLGNFVNKVFVETGTYRGDTVQAALDVGFEKVYSIELDKSRFNKCKRRFEGDSRVELFHGDTIMVLPLIVEKIGQKSTFWLDAHITKGTFGLKKCPLVEELDIISRHHIKDHVIMIDDRRLLGRKRFGKVTEKSVIKSILKVNPNYNIFYHDGLGPKNSHIEDDIIIAKIGE